MIRRICLQLFYCARGNFIAKMRRLLLLSTPCTFRPACTCVPCVRHRQTYEFALAAMNARGTSRTSSEGRGSRAHVRPPAVCTPLSGVTSDDTAATPGATESTPPVTRTPLFTSDNVHPVEYLHIHYIPRALSNATSGLRSIEW